MIKKSVRLTGCIVWLPASVFAGEGTFGLVNLPDRGSTIVLIGLGLLGMVALHRKWNRD
jgi:hypothetical protein